LKVYKELERMLKVSEIKMSVDKVLALAKTITAIQIKLPLNKEVYTQTMLMERHQKIVKLFDEDFGWRNDEVRKPINLSQYQTTSKTISLGGDFFLNCLIFLCNKGCKSHNLLIYTLVCGERGIKTIKQNHLTSLSNNIKTS